MKKINTRATLAVLLAIASITIVVLLVLDLFVKMSENNKLIVDILLIFVLVVSFFFLGIISLLLFKLKFKNANELINSINNIELTKDKVFETGVITYNSEKIISFISPWILNEGFDKILGRNISKLNLNLNTEKKQILEYGKRVWSVVISRKNKIILLKDVTSKTALKKIVKEQQNSVLSLHISFSKKLNFNEASKSEALLKITQANQEWANKIGGIFNSTISSENTSIIIFRWNRGEKYLGDGKLLEDIKQSLGKLSKDTTISIGVSFGVKDLMELFETSLRTLEIAKNRGGDQIVIERSDGEVIYIGESSIQKTSSSMMNIKKFYSEFIEDVNKSKEIFITSHKNADLDALGSSLGSYELIKSFSKTEVKIIIETMDSTTQKFFDSFPKQVKDLFITENEAIKISDNRSHVLLIDTSDPLSSQAKKLIDQISPENLSIIDHHRLGQNDYDFIESKVLIETSISSASEILVEMIKMSFLNNNALKLSSEVSTALLSGIQLDSKQLTKNVTNFTFEAVSYLINNEANTTEISQMFKPDQSLIKIESVALKNVTKPVKNIIFTFIPEFMTVDDEVSSIIADNLLGYEGIDASFVLVKLNSNRFKLSARSNNNINVQLICESIGGGGHFNSSAVSWSTNIKFNTIKKKVLAAISKNKGDK